MVFSFLLYRKNLRKWFIILCSRVYYERLKDCMVPCCSAKADICAESGAWVLVIWDTKSIVDLGVGCVRLFDEPTYLQTPIISQLKAWAMKSILKNNFQRLDFFMTTDPCTWLSFAKYLIGKFSVIYCWNKDASIFYCWF